MEYSLVKEFYAMFEACNAHLGANKKYLHASIRNYIYTAKSRRSVIDLSYISNNIYALYKLIPVILSNNGKILIVATSSDISRMSKGLLTFIHPNVHVLTTRWPSGFRTNFTRFSQIVKVYNQTSDLNKSIIMKDKYTRKYKEIEGMGLSHTMPSIVIFMNTVEQDMAVNEVNKLGITSVGFVNSDSHMGGKFTYTMPIGGSLDAMITAIILLRDIIVAGDLNKPLVIGTQNSTLESVSAAKNLMCIVSNKSDVIDRDYPISNYLYK